MKLFLCHVKILVLIIFCTSKIEAQIKVFDDRCVSVGTLTNYKSSLNIYAYDKRGVTLKTNYTNDWCQTMISIVDNPTTASYVVNYDHQDRFYVAGAGWIWSYGGHYFGSDEKFKTNIKEIESSLDKVKQLNGITFDTKNDDGIDSRNNLKSTSSNSEKRQRMGLVAQDVEKVVPEVVRTMHDGTKAIAYQELTALLIEALKEQQNQIEELEKKVDELSGIYTNSNIYPNPSTFEANLDLVIPNNIRKATLKIFAYDGKLIKKINISDRGKSTISFDTSELNAGVYKCTLVADGSILSSNSIIKE